MKNTLFVAALLLTATIGLFAKAQTTNPLGEWRNNMLLRRAGSIPYLFGTGGTITEGTQ